MPALSGKIYIFTENLHLFLLKEKAFCILPFLTFMSELAICLKDWSSDRIIVREVSCKFQSVSTGHEENIVRSIFLQLGIRYKHWMYGSKHKSSNNNLPWKSIIFNSYHSLLIMYKISSDRTAFLCCGENFGYTYWSQGTSQRRESKHYFITDIKSQELLE